MQVINAPFPDRISFGARSEPEWATELVATFSGFEATQQNWVYSRHRYDVSLAVRTASDYAAVRTHFHTVRGRAKGFLFVDPLDNTVTVAQGITAEGAESSDSWQFLKRYGSGADAYDRRITRPTAGSVAVFRTRSAVTTDVTSSCTIDHDTGTFTVSGDAAGDVYTWAGSFSVPCRYDVDRLPAAIINKQPNGELLVSCEAIPLVEVRE
jgi:uncharacterized protein (TIGR02217 family)